MTLEDALMWLNDRRGKSVAVWISVEQGDADFMVLSAQGELRHWSEAKAAHRAVGRDDIRGLYEIGAAALDLSDTHPRDVSTWPNDPSHLSMQLDENTTLHFVEQEGE